MNLISVLLVLVSTFVPRYAHAAEVEVKVVYRTPRVGYFNNLTIFGTNNSRYSIQINGSTSLVSDLLYFRNSSQAAESLKQCASLASYQDLVLKFRVDDQQNNLSPTPLASRSFILVPGTTISCSPLTTTVQLNANLAIRVTDDWFIRGSIDYQAEKFCASQNAVLESVASATLSAPTITSWYSRTYYSYNVSALVNCIPF